MTTVLVTGATDGLGRGVAAELSRRGMKVLVHGRDRSRAEAAAEEIGAPSVHLADLSSFAQVRELAEELPAVDVLVNNAGLISQDRVVTEDGIELTLQVNHLSHFLLTLALLERDDPPRRVVHVASAGQAPLDFDDLMLERDYDPWRAYRQSKLAQIMFSNELAERRPDVESSPCTPRRSWTPRWCARRSASRTARVEEGIEATVRLIDDPGLPVTGRYFNGPRSPPGRDGLRRGRPQAALGRLGAARHPVTAAIVITGAPGAGKSSVAQAFTTLLDNAGIEHGAIESEQLAWGRRGCPTSWSTSSSRSWSPPSGASAGACSWWWRRPRPRRTSTRCSRL